jgi:hypothetical protein
MNTYNIAEYSLKVYPLYFRLALIFSTTWLFYDGKKLKKLKEAASPDNYS